MTAFSASPVLRRAPLLLALAFALSASFPAGAAQPSDNTAPGSPAADRFTAQGLSIGMSIVPAGSARPAAPAEGEEAELSFRITDSATGAPVSSLYPSAWMDPRGENGAAGSAPPGCGEKVRMFTRGIAGLRPMVDLTSWFLLALNKDATISVIDPIVGVGGLTQLYAQVLLRKPGEDWARSADGKRLYVTMPRAGRVAVVETDSFKVVAEVEAGSRPVRVAVQPDGKYVWAGNDAPGGGSGVVAIDADRPAVVADIPTGAGHHELAFSGDSRFAFVTNRDAGTVSVIDIRTRKKIRDVPTGGRPLSLAWSPLAGAVFVADEDGGGIAVVDGTRHEVTARIPARPGLRSIRFAAEGRWGFAVNAVDNTVSVIDSSTARVAHVVPVDAAPDQVVFSRAFAYVRSLGSEFVTMIPLSESGMGGPLQTKKFTTGALPPIRAPYVPVADAIAPTPEPYAVVAANPAEKTIFYYSEGMTAPMGNFRNYGHEPLAAMVVDRSLRERSPGVYSARVRFPASGEYDVAFLLDTPRIVHCFRTTVRPDPRLEKAVPKGLDLEYLSVRRTIRVGETVPLRMRITDRATKQAVAGLPDVVVHLSLVSGNWQRRETATHAGEGVYEAPLSLPRPGVYFLHVECPSRKAHVRDLPFLSLEATDGGPAEKIPPGRKRGK
ncbi:MAG: cytochrome D1 domain-containing protein [Deltaproteobacteria bacterium]